MKNVITIFSLLLATSANAQMTFQKTFGLYSTEYGFSVGLTDNGGYVIAGSSQSFGTGDYDVYLIRTDANGDTLWTATVGNTSTDFGYSAAQTSDGGFIVTGEKGGSGGDVYLIKTDSAGNLLWTTSISLTFLHNQFGRSVRETRDSGFIICGDFEDYLTNGYEMYLIRTNRNGDTLWSNVFGGANEEHGLDVVQCTDGSFISCGYTGSYGAGFNDAFLIKADSMGQLIWAKTYGGPGFETAFSVKQTADGGYIVGGSMSFAVGVFDAYLIKTDSIGDTLWTKTYGGTGSNGIRTVQEIPTGGFIGIGSTDAFGAGVTDAFIIRTDANGNLMWSKTYGGTAADNGQSIQQSNDGGFIAVGFTESFGAGGNDIYFIKTDSLGNSGCNENTVFPLVTTPSTQVINFNPSVVSLGTIGFPQPIIHRGGTVTNYCIGNVDISKIPDPNSILVGPNPSDGTFFISSSDNTTHGFIEVSNILGERIAEEELSGKSKKEIRLNNISDGIYFVKVFQGAKYHCWKLIIEQN